MSLREFFQASRGFRFPLVPEVTTTSVKEFFDQTAGTVIASAKNIVAIHDMLVKYAKDALGHDSPARFLSRLHESVVVGNRQIETRRGGVTIMADGLNYVFASNYFARVVYMLAYYGWKPDMRDFKDMILQRRVFLGFPLKGMTPGEQRISAYPTKRNAEYQTGNLYAPGWYLAHIVGVMDPFVGPEAVDLRGQVLPRGELDDWRIINDVPVRQLDTVLSPEEKKVVVAQFLRFLDPMDYVLVPNQRRECHKPQTRTRIGEEPCVISYLKAWMRCYVNAVRPNVYEEFCDLALAPRANGDQVAGIDIIGGTPIKVRTTTESMKNVGGKIERKTKAVKVKAPRHVLHDDTCARPEGLKALRRMRLWSQRPEGHPYRIIRAFLLAERDGVASYDLIKNYCTDNVRHPEMFVARFTERGSWDGMKSDGGNSYGHVFDQEGDEVRTWPPVQNVLMEYRDEFLR